MPQIVTADVTLNKSLKFPQRQDVISMINFVFQDR